MRFVLTMDIVSRSYCKFMDQMMENQLMFGILQAII